MNRINKLKWFVSGFLVGCIAFTGAAYAATKAKIDVYFLPLKYYFDGVQRQPSEHNKGFIYNNTTYVPLRFISESLGMPVHWDGKTYSIYIGKGPEGKVTYLENMPTFTDSAGRNWKFMSNFKTNTGITYSHAYLIYDDLWGWADKASKEYLLKDYYRKFQAYLAPEFGWTKNKKNDNIGSVKIYLDDKLVFDSGPVPSDLIEPIKIDIDVFGATKFKIEAEGIGLGILDAKFIQ